MGHITDEHVSAMNDRVAQAATTKRAFDLLDTLTRTMVDRLLDLNGHDLDMLRGYGLAARRDIVAADHGWDWNERDDDEPADGHGPCDLGRHEPHSRRPLECRRCRRRKIDHRRTPVAA